MTLLKYIKIRSYEMGLVFRDGEFQGLLGDRYALAARPARQDSGRGRVAARAVAGPREARRDRQVGCAGRPRRRPGPEGPRAWPGLDRRPLQPHPAAGPVRLLDWARRKCGSRSSMRGRSGSSTRTSSVIVRSSACQAAARHLHGRARPRRRAVHRRPLRRDAAAGPVRLLEGTG